MHTKPVSPAVDIAARVLLLRKQEPKLPALDVLDYAMRRRRDCWIDFGVLAFPPAPFALIVAEGAAGKSRNLSNGVDPL